MACGKKNKPHNMKSLLLCQCLTNSFCTQQLYICLYRPRKHLHITPSIEHPTCIIQGGWDNLPIPSMFIHFVLCLPERKRKTEVFSLLVYFPKICNRQARLRPTHASIICCLPPLDDRKMGETQTSRG